MKILNLYAGIGGNRKLWGDEHEVTAVEINPDIARVYKDRFANDRVIIDDAHQYLLKNFAKFDFIWSSPPCPTHGQYRYNVGVKAKGYDPVYPDMALYEEVIFLQYHHPGLYAIENTISYYSPLVEPQKVARHYFWANFDIPQIKLKADGLRSRNKISDCEKHVGVSLQKYKMPNKRQVLRNCVNPEIGRHVLEAAL